MQTKFLPEVSSEPTLNQETDSLNFEDLEINSEYPYAADDVRYALEATLYKENQFFAPGCRYLLESEKFRHKRHIQNRSGNSPCRVAILPPLIGSVAYSFADDFLHQYNHLQDVFAEFMPHLDQKPHYGVKILFPYRKIAYKPGEIATQENSANSSKRMPETLNNAHWLINPFSKTGKAPGNLCHCVRGAT